MGDAFVRRRRRLLSLEGGENGAGQDTGSGDDPPGDGGGGRGGLLGGVVGGGVVGDGRLGDPGGLLVLLGLGLGRRGRRRRRGRGRLGAEQLVGERHLVDGVDGEGEVLADDGGEQRPVDAGGDVDVVVRRLDLVLVRAVGAGRLRVHGAAEGGEHGEAVEPREHAVEHQLDLVLRRQRVERARLERRERGVRGREHGQPVVAVHQLAVDLGVHPALVEEPEEGGVLAGLLQHCRHVRRRGAVGRRRRGPGDAGVAFVGVAAFGFCDAASTAAVASSAARRRRREDAIGGWVGVVARNRTNGGGGGDLRAGSSACLIDL